RLTISSSILRIQPPPSFGTNITLHRIPSKSHIWQVEPVKIDDFEPAAEAILPKGVFDYIAGGAEDEATLRGNRQAFARYQFRFKILASADQPDLTSEVLGQRFRMPVHLAPTAIQRMAHPDGEAAAYQAASDAGVAFCLSTLSSLSIEEVAAAGTGVRWLQLYMPRGL